MNNYIEKNRFFTVIWTFQIDTDKTANKGLFAGILIQENTNDESSTEG